MKPKVLLLDNGQPSRCWEMLGTSGKRLWPYCYPTVYLNRRAVSARRHSYERVNGPIPEGYRVYSYCGHLRCVSPDHLYLRRWKVAA